MPNDREPVHQKPRPVTNNRGKRERRNIYTALEDTNFLWDEDLLPDVRFLWSEGHHIADMAKYFKRKPLEMFVLILDQLERGMLRRREGGIHGLQLGDCPIDLPKRKEP